MTLSWLLAGTRATKGLWHKAAEGGSAFGTAAVGAQCLGVTLVGFFSPAELALHCCGVMAGGKQRWVCAVLFGNQPLCSCCSFHMVCSCSERVCVDLLSMAKLKKT